MEPVKPCGVCFEEIVGDEFITHDRCTTNFHRDHLASWFYYRDTLCPLCGSKFDEDTVEELDPENTDEQEELKKIAEEFSIVKSNQDTAPEYGKIYLRIQLTKLTTLLLLFISGILLIVIGIMQGSSTNLLFYLLIVGGLAMDYYLVKQIEKTYQNVKIARVLMI